MPHSGRPALMTNSKPSPPIAAATRAGTKACALSAAGFARARCIVIGCSACIFIHRSRTHRCALMPQVVRLAGAALIAREVQRRSG